MSLSFRNNTDRPRNLGDAQPYIALGQRLMRDGHRVRFATHDIFKPVVDEAGLEFFGIGGDPQDLMSYMVKSKPFNSCFAFIALTEC